LVLHPCLGTTQRGCGGRSSLSVWFFTLVLALLNGAVGGGLVVLCYKSFVTPTHEVGVVLRLCLVAGTLMLTFVLLLILFIFCSWIYSGPITQECKGVKEKVAMKSVRKILVILGLSTVLVLLISILMDLSVVGMLWWTNHQLDNKYQVFGNCFCEKNTDVYSLEMNNLNIECPHIPGFKCPAVYNSAIVSIGSMTVSVKECQSLSGGPQDSTCMEYLTFWNMFKVLRILLPVLVMFKLPVLLGNCNRRVSNQEKNKDRQKQEKFATDSLSWVGLEFLISPLKMVDPVQFYSDICAPIKTGPPLGERLGPVGQEHDGEGSIQSKPTLMGVRPKRTKFASIGRPVPSCSVKKASLGELKDSVFQDDSPPDPGRHKFSTPKHPRMDTPIFDLSKVVKPQHMDASYTEIPDCKLIFKATGCRVSTLASQDVKIPRPPPLPKGSWSESQSLSHYPPPPFSRTSTTLPKPIHSNSDVVKESSSLTSTRSDILFPTECSPSSTSLYRRQHHGTRLLKSHVSPNQLQISFSNKEISEKKRERPKSAVEWTKLP